MDSCGLGNPPEKRKVGEVTPRAWPGVRGLDLGEEGGIDPYVLDCASRRSNAEVVPLE